MTLNDRQFFHGTRAEITDTVLPASATGITNHAKLQATPGEEWRKDAVFTTTDEYEAWHYANEARSPHDGRPRVYRVQPSDDVDDAGPRRGTTVYHRSSSATVLDQIDIPPGEQGRLPLDKDWDKVNPMKGGEAFRRLTLNAKEEEVAQRMTFREAQARRQWPRMF